MTPTGFELNFGRRARKLSVRIGNPENGLPCKTAGHCGGTGEDGKSRGLFPGWGIAVGLWFDTNATHLFTNHGLTLPACSLYSGGYEMASSTDPAGACSECPQQGCSSCREASCSSCSQAQGSQWSCSDIPVFSKSGQLENCNECHRPPQIYTYADNSPISKADPTGHYAIALNPAAVIALALIVYTTYQTIQNIERMNPTFRRIRDRGCRCSLRLAPPDIMEQCPPRVFGKGVTLGECQNNAKLTAPQQCRQYYGHCGWVF
jgi:hypothetical protein